MNNRFRKLPFDLLLLAGMLVAALVVFWPIGHHQFITYDGDAYVAKNPGVQGGLTREGVVWAFTTIYTGNWHPLTWLSHMADCELYGLHPAGHHWTNLLLHLISTALLFGALRRMTGSPGRSAVVAWLFAVHPLHVESVAWIAERKDVLSTVFWMSTMWAYAWYADRPGAGRYLLVVLSLAAGLLAKPMLVTLPFVLLLLDYWPLGRMPRLAVPASLNAPGAVRRRLREWGLRVRAVQPLVLEKLPLIGVAVAAGLMTLMAQRLDGSVGSLDRFPLAERVANAVISYATYLIKAAWPTRLAVFYPYDPESLSLERLIGSAALLVAITLLVIARAKRSPYLLAGWLWYMGTLVPVIGLLQVGEQARADRYTYVPLVGIFVMVVWTVSDWAGKSRYRRIALSLVSVGVILALMSAARSQVVLWKDNTTLFEHALSVTKRNHVAHYMIAGELMARGDRDGAISHYTAAIEYKPDWAGARNNLAVLFEQEGRLDDAIEQYRAALEDMPRYALAHNNLGVLLAKKGRYAEAVSHYEAALLIDPAFADAHKNLGLLLLQQGRTQEGLRHLFAVRPD
jgi:lipoprotein NlpI